MVITRTGGASGRTGVFMGVFMEIQVVFKMHEKT